MTPTRFQCQLNSTGMMTLIVFIFGSITCALSGFIAFRFHREQLAAPKGFVKRLQCRLRDQLIGESIMSFVTLVFSFGAYIGQLQYWPIWVQSTMRMVMFSVTGATSIALLLTVLQISRIKSGDIDG